MSTLRQIEANRLNAQKSTGPRTTAGKGISRFNSLHHGIDARELVIPGENQQVFEALIDHYHQHFQPVGPYERFLVDTMIQADWQLRRLALAEAHLLASTPEGAAYGRTLSEQPFIRLFRRQQAYERAYFKAVHEYRRFRRDSHHSLEPEELIAEPVAEAAEPAAETVALRMPAAIPLRQQEINAIGFVPSPGRAPSPHGTGHANLSTNFSKGTTPTVRALG